MVASIDVFATQSSSADENLRIPAELNAHSNVFELKTIGDARQALARLRELRRDFDAGMKRDHSSGNPRQAMTTAQSSNRDGEAMLSELSNIQRMRTIRSEIAYLEDLMVRIAQREFEMEELRHSSYLTCIGEWSERGSRRPVI